MKVVVKAKSKEPMKFAKGGKMQGKKGGGKINPTSGFKKAPFAGGGMMSDDDKKKKTESSKPKPKPYPWHKTPAAQDRLKAKHEPLAGRPAYSKGGKTSKMPASKLIKK